MTDHRAAVGPRDKYDVISAHVFGVLTAAGLRSTDYVLDVGCGVLRVGRLLLVYLDAGRYHAIEPNASLVCDGIDGEHLRELWKAKDGIAAITDCSDFATHFDRRFDVILAHSILTHASRSQVVDLFRESAAVLAPSGTMFATFNPADEDYAGEEWATGRGIGYRPSTILDIASDAGLTGGALVPPTPHPTWQCWLAFTSAETSGPPQGQWTGRAAGSRAE